MPKRKEVKRTGSLRKEVPWSGSSRADCLRSETKMGAGPAGLQKRFLSKSTFNTHDIMHSPVEKTLRMISEILSGERLFTM
ncbi:MAG: hypothetical protein HY093_02730 [Candidatus Liptonbacteria bacterium]|nr:hypothetical protein [Candidatus Liptonbacteria bacterium]